MERPTPNLTFLVLGAAKSGTTSLCQALDGHPEVFLSEPKEPVFFEAEYERGLGYYAARYLRGWSGEKAVGEGRVYNLFLPYVAPRIRESLPGARLIAILRNPVDRAYSHWWHRVTRGYERRSFEDTAGEELERLERGERFAAARSEPLWRGNFFTRATRSRTLDVKEVPTLEMGYYAEQLRRYLDLFPASQVKTMLFEDFTKDPDAVLRDLFTFLHLDSDAVVSDADPQNVALESVKSRLAFQLEKLSWLTGVNAVVPKHIRTRIRMLLSERDAQRPRMPDAVRERLADHFAGPNLELQRLIGRDLSAWNFPASARPSVAKR